MEDSEYLDRAQIFYNFGETIIKIPSPKNWLLIYFSGFWLFGWIVGGISILIVIIMGLINGHSFSIEWFFFIIGWPIGVFFVGRYFLWSFKGYELIIFKDGLMTIMKKYAILSPLEKYNLSFAKNFRTIDDYNDQDFLGYPKGDKLSIDNVNRIQFEYESKIIKFAGGIDEIEGLFLLKILKEKNLLQEKHFEK